MLTKTAVYDFIDKVENKALETLKTNYKTDLDKAIELTLNEPQNAELLAAIKSLEKHINEGVKAQIVIKRNVPRWSNALHTRDIRKELFGYNNYYFPKGFDSIRAVHVEYEEKIRKTKEEYTKIKNIVKTKKTGEKGKDALITLGFDVAYLDKVSTLPVIITNPEPKIDKSLLFPCGEHGITE